MFIDLIKDELWVCTHGKGDRPFPVAPPNAAFYASFEGSYEEDTKDTRF